MDALLGKDSQVVDTKPVIIIFLQDTKVSFLTFQIPFNSSKAGDKVKQHTSTLGQISYRKICRRVDRFEKALKSKTKFLTRTGKVNCPKNALPLSR